MAESKKKVPSLESFLDPVNKITSWADSAEVDEPVSAEEVDVMDEHANHHRSPSPPPPQPTLPSNPPFTVFLKNISYKSDREDIVHFFGKLKTDDIRMVQQNGQFKGVCYVDFATQDDLRVALDHNGIELMGRTINVSLADPSRQHRGPPRRRGWNGGKEHHRDDSGGFQRDDGHKQQLQDVRGIMAPRSDDHRRSHKADEPAAISQRRKLNLKPRTMAPTVVSADKSASAVAPPQKANPFGSARPREDVLAARKEEPKAPIRAKESKPNNTPNVPSQKQQQPRQQQHVAKEGNQHWRGGHTSRSHSHSNRRANVGSAEPRKVTHKGHERRHEEQPQQQQQQHHQPQQRQPQQPRQQRQQQQPRQPQHQRQPPARAMPEATAEPVVQANKFGALLDDDQ